MPYKMFKKNGKFCVMNEDTGESKGCSDTRSMAIKHMRALYAAESGAKMGKKEIDEVVNQSIDPQVFDDDTSETKEYMGVPYGVTSFADLEATRSAQERAHELYELSADFVGLVNNVVYDSETTDKGAAILSLAQQLSERLSGTEKTDQSGHKDNKLDAAPSDAQNQEAVKVVEQVPVKGIFGKERKKNKMTRGLLGDVITKIKSIFDKEQPTDTFMIWKEADDAAYNFLLSYSNNFRDNDNPPEIISEASHRYFVEQVDKGLVALPELWIWHVKDWKIGTANAVAYDDSGFAIAIGTIDKDKSEIAEWLYKNGNDFKLSHGMPIDSIERDREDPSVITKHITREISYLPGWAAANSLTNFVIIQPDLEEEKAMIPAEKKEILVSKYGMRPELLDRLEKVNSEKAAQAVEEGLERKEADVEETVTQENENQEEEKVTVTDASVDMSAYATREETADAFGAVLGEMKNQMIEMSNQMGLLAETVNAMSKEITALKETDDVKVSKIVSGVPVASLSHMLTQSILGKSKAEVGSDDELANQKPAHNLAADKEGTHPGGVGIPFIDKMISSQ